MIVAPLGSGSAGNAYYFEDEGTSILIDAGLGPRETKKRLEAVGQRFEELQAIVLTHEHYDHIRGAESIARKLGIPIYLTRGTLDASSIDPFETKTVVFENNSAFRIGNLEVHAQRTIHDAADPACFVVQAGDGTRVGLASDLGYVDPAVLRHLQKCDGLLFEANHDVDMLRLGTYPWSLKRRILSRFGHLSNDDSIRALQRMIGAETKSLCLIHLSEKNNLESIVRTMATRLITGLGAPIDLEIAQQSTPAAVLRVSRRGGRPRQSGAAQMPLFAL
jgi:phosphoribosyl 1,2-cyclic phosphodiesterase